MFQIRTFSGNCYNTYACSLTYEVFLLLFRGTTNTAVFRSENIPRYNERETRDMSWNSLSAFVARAVLHARFWSVYTSSVYRRDTSLPPCWRTRTKDSSLASVVSSSNMAATSLSVEFLGIDLKRSVDL